MSRFPPISIHEDPRLVCESLPAAALKLVSRITVPACLGDLVFVRLKFRRLAAP